MKFKIKNVVESGLMDNIELSKRIFNLLDDKALLSPKEDVLLREAEEILVTHGLLPRNK